MKIAIVSPGSFSVPPVIGSSVEHDIQMVAEQFANDHQVYVYTRKCPEYQNSTTHGNLHYIRFQFNTYDTYIKKVGKHLKKMEPDIVLVENRPSYVLYLKQRIPYTPIILNMHSTVFSSPPVIARKDMVKVSKSVDALITNSHYLKSYFVNKYPAFKEKTYAVHLGIHTSPFEEVKEQEERISRWKKKYKIKKEDQTILFVGRLLKAKGIHLLFDVFPKLVKEFPKLKLVITGSPVYGRDITTDYVRSIRKKRGKLDSHIIFTKFIPPRKIPIIYQLADIVVIPSLWNEPFGRVNLEAMASTKPVVASDRGGIPELIKHEENGCIFSVKNYKEELYCFLHKLLESKELRDEFGQRGLEIAKEFSWEKTAEGYLHVFESLIEKEKVHLEEAIYRTEESDSEHEGTNTLCGEGDEASAIFLQSAENDDSSCE